MYDVFVIKSSKLLWVNHRIVSHHSVSDKYGVNFDKY